MIIFQNLPRFQPENMEKNALIFERVSQMAARKGCTSSQLALAWVHHQGSDVCPIPGTTKIANFNQNLGALSVKLTPDEMPELESYAAMDGVQGDRYHSTFLNTWRDSETPPLSSWKGNQICNIRTIICVCIVGRVEVICISVFRLLASLASQQRLQHIQ